MDFFLATTMESDPEDWEGFQFESVGSSSNNFSLSQPKALRRNMRFGNLQVIEAIILCLGLASVFNAQDDPASKPADQQAPVPGEQPRAATPAAPPPTALPTPTFVGPLQDLPPATFESGPFGNLAVNGV